MRSLLLLLLLNACVVYCAHLCTKLDDCSCQWSNGTITTLRDIGVKGGIRFVNVSDPLDEGYLYSYNPCYPFNVGTNCTKAAVCATIPGGSVMQYGRQDGAEFNMEKFGDNDELSLTLTYTNPKPVRKAKLYIICTSHDPAQPFNVLEESPEDPPVLLMTLSHSSVCAREPMTSSPESHDNNLSPGSILCIVFVSSAVVYILGGVFILKFIKKREGSAIIPHYQFWSNLPGYVKDGVMFTFVKLLAAVYGR